MNKLIFFSLSLVLLLSLSQCIPTLAQTPAALAPAPVQTPAALAPALAQTPPAPAVAAAPAVATAPSVAAAPAVVAASPASSGPPKITKILEKASQFTIFLKLLRTTQVGNQLNGQLNDSTDGLTVFAPPDSAFSSLKAGTLNSLSDGQKAALVQFHVIPSYIAISEFQTVSNPIRTQAGDTTKYEFPLNVTTSGNQVNISTGIVNTTIHSTIYTDNQLAVYQVDKVLLPLNIFGPHPPPAPAPSPEPAKKNKPATVVSSSTDNGGSSRAVGPLSVHLIGVAAIAGIFLL